MQLDTRSPEASNKKDRKKRHDRLRRRNGMEIVYCTVVFEDNTQFVLCAYSVVTDLALKNGR